MWAAMTSCSSPSPERVERVCQAVVRCFKRLVQPDYTETDRKNGYVLEQGPHGQPWPILPCLRLPGHRGYHGPCQIGDISKRAADVKKWAKSIPGNVYVRDRRAPLVEIDQAPSN